MPQPSEHEIEVFNFALELPAGERTAYLDRVCAGDAALRQRVEELLKASEVSCAWLESSDTAPQGPSGTVRSSRVPAEKPGDRIGHYKLLQQIGEGGCGVVYMAEQEEPVRRRVALKVIKLGMDTKQVIARFEAERQALALMDHPNIAKVLEAGATDTGRPYFVMELVRGIKITDYCDENNLSTRERLDLFIQVCRAIQHAHQKGIIHRDIKPSNILVTMDDRAPVPKVIDFGIAKATQGKLTDHTLFTAFEQFVGTPAYMSPEQAEMRALDIDTRSDIYSLGVLLYELLTGRTPFEAKRLLEAGLDEIRRIIREEEPPRPSTRLHTLEAAEQTTVAKVRRSDPPKLAHLIRGDLDWIVMKALEKERNRRYETANGLAADIQRHLSNEPVVARPPSAGDRLQKAFRRNKLAFAAAGTVAAALLLGVMVSTWQAVRATKAEKLARKRLAEVAAERDGKEEARKEAEAISTFLTEVFQSPDPQREGRSITVAETLDKAVKKLDHSLKNQPTRRAQIQETLARTYYALGLARDATLLAEKARDSMLAAKGADNPDTIRVIVFMGICYSSVGRYDDAIKVEEETLALSRKVNGPEDPGTIQAMRALGYAYSGSGRWDDARLIREKVLALSRKVNGPEDTETLKTMIELAHSYLDVHRYDESSKLLEQAVAVSRRIQGPADPRTLNAMIQLESTYSGAGRPEEAVKIGQDVLRLSRNINGPEHPATILAMSTLGSSYAADGRTAEAIKLLEETLPLSLRVNGPKQRTTVAIRNNLSDYYAGSGQWSNAAAGFSYLVELSPAEHWWCHSLALLLVQTGDLDGYRRHCAQELARFGSTDNPFIAWRMAEDCLILPDKGAEMDGPVKLADVAVTKGAGQQDFAWFEFVKGLAEYREGHLAGAVEWMQKVLANTTAVDGPETDAIVDSLHAEAYLVLAMARRQLGQSAESRAAFAKGAEIIDTKLPRLEKDPLGNYWMGWIIDHALLKEAKALIEAPSAPK